MTGNRYCIFRKYILPLSPKFKTFKILGYETSIILCRRNNPRDDLIDFCSTDA